MVEQNQTPEKVSVSGNEYSQEDLERYVGMGKTVEDFESRYNTKLDNLMPAYTQATQKLSDYEKRMQDAEAEAMQNRANQGGQLSPDEQRRLGQQILNDWGYVSRDSIPELVEEQVEGFMIARDARSFAQRVSSEGKPEVTPQELIMEMQRTGKDMDEAYMGMFPSRLAEWERSKVSEDREGWYSQASGAQSARMPEATKMTKDNLEEMVDKALSGEL